MAPKQPKQVAQTLQSAIRQLKPEYENTDEILLYILGLTRPECTEKHDCFEWEQAIEPIKKVFEHDSRFTERTHARELLEHIRDHCPDDKKHLIKHILK